MRRGAIGALAALGLLWSASARAQGADATRFGERESVQHISLSPDGKRVVFIAPGKGSGTIAYVAAPGTAPQRILSTDGDPEKLMDCRWSSDTRIVCQVFLLMEQYGDLVPYTRMVSLNPDGSDGKLLSAPTSFRAVGVAQTGGQIIDWLGSDDGSVLMTRDFVPETTIGTRMADTRQGYGVERIDTRTLRREVVEAPRDVAIEYISDGHGKVRVMGVREQSGTGQDSGTYRYYYRTADGREWLPLSTLDTVRETGFNPYAVDRDLNVAYGLDKLDGRMALYRISLDGTLKRELVHSRPDVDIDGLIRIGREGRVVGVGWATDRREALFFDPKLKALAAALSKALPGLPLIQFVDASADETRLLLWAGSDVDPGRYYVFDRTAKKLEEIMLSRPSLEGRGLAQVKPITFTAADGTQIPGYLTLPPGSDGKRLPAIVMPHGGPGARDEWGFDWLAQFFAARGFAVLQPNFRGSAGYGESWFVNNGFKSWRVAIGDVNDGGRWLVSQGIADPAKLAIVGWSYGGYAALQSSVLDAELFKAIVAIAPVTDLAELKNEWRQFSNWRLTRDFIGSGAHIEEGSPARHAAKIKAPVLLFHGDRDRNVGVGESRLMASRLKDAGKKVELVIYPGLDHQLDDGAARTGMLDKADNFLRTSLGIAAAP